ncbi:hypothetical protein PFISCL1PPCAC_9581, partial [Pristionchus fissidentatus]
ASTPDSTASVEQPGVRRSARLADKTPINYNEAAIFQKLLKKAPAKKPVKRKNAKDKETKLRRGGSIAIRIVNSVEDVASSCGSTSGSSRSYSVISTVPYAPSIDRRVLEAVPISDKTPVTARPKESLLRDRKAPPTRGLKTIAEDRSESASASTSASSSTVSTSGSYGVTVKGGKTHAAITPVTSVSSTSSTILVPIKQRQRLEKERSPDDLPEAPRGRQQVRGKTLFPLANEHDVTITVPDNTILLDDDEELPMGTVAKTTESVTVAKDTVADKLTKKSRRGPSLIAQRIAISKENKQLRQPVRYDDDDYFAEEFSLRSTDASRRDAVSFLDDLSMGNITIADLPKGYEWLSELHSPAKTATPNLDASLRNSRVLTLSSSSPSPAGKSDGGRRAAKGMLSDQSIKVQLFIMARKRLSDIYDQESDSSSEKEVVAMSPHSKFRQTYAQDPSDEAYQKYIRRIHKQPHVRAKFAASGKAGFNKTKDAPKMPASTRLLKRPKMQYPGIAPLPASDDDDEETTVARMLPDLDRLSIL